MGANLTEAQAAAAEAGTLRAAGGIPEGIKHLANKSASTERIAATAANAAARLDAAAVAFVVVDGVAMAASSFASPGGWVGQEG